MEMDRCELICDLGNMAISKYDSITASICFNIGGKYFPEKGWNDFIIVVLNWWIISMVEMICGHNNESILSFMDGPYLLKVGKNASFVYYELFDHGNVVNSGHFEVDLKRFLRGILVVAEEVILKCVENGWRTEEIIKLEKNIKIGLGHLR